MKKSLLAVSTIIFVSMMFLSGCCKPPKLASVGVSLVPQHRDWWCWAATTEMISIYYGHRVDQCESANFVHGTPPDCCTGCTGDCPCWGGSWGASITDIKNNWAHWKFDYEYSNSSIAWSDLRKIISTTPSCNKSPIQAVWWWTGGGGHVVTIYGYTEIGNQHYISYYNPLPVDCQKSGTTCLPGSGGEDVVRLYANFASDASHTWGDSFYEFKYVGP